MAKIPSSGAILLLAAFVLTAAAWVRGAEYDEQYTLFLTAGTPRPDWPDTVFPAGAVAAMQVGHASLMQIARDLRATDVHPPLYFWVVSLWREALGSSLFATRMLSVLCGLLSLSLIGSIARRCAIPAVPAMLLTLGCYGFVYVDAIARGFAPAQLLTLCGVGLLLRQRPLLAGISLGAACCCNYLAVFVAAAVIGAAGAWGAVLAAIPFLAVDAWFLVGQHAARTGQFPPFQIWPSLQRLGEYETASVFGGLPLYVDGIWCAAIAAMLGLLVLGLATCIARRRPWSAGPAESLLLAGALAPPIGLLLLGATFDNTPIELRYLTFGLPFVALLIAWALLPRNRRASGTYVTLMRISLALQFVGIAGLLLSQRTMQPARATAVEAGRLAGDGIVLLPRGNDGVGIVGAFGIEAAAALPLLVIRPAESIADRIAPYHRVILALLAQDRDSIATIPLLRTELIEAHWRRVAIGFNVEVYERTCGRE